MPRIPPPPPPEPTRQLHPLEIECREAFAREDGYGTPATDLRYRTFRDGWYAGRATAGAAIANCHHQLEPIHRHGPNAPAEGCCSRCLTWAEDLAMIDPYARPRSTP